VEATLATMVEDASVDHVPVTTGGKGKTALRAFYRDCSSARGRTTSR
jgi:carboxymethylenebutenolidase